jgi:predicted dehydrogenase
MVHDIDGLEAADCPTDTGSHHIAATETLQLGLHTLCEKPLALTVRGCKRIIEAAAQSGRILSVAENFRRDPMNRLVKALIDDGAIGSPHFIMDSEIGGRDSIIITPWRHMKLTGTITLDAGVHNADILQYYFGDAYSAFGQVRLFEKRRVRRGTDGPAGFYAKWAANMPESIEPTGEDAMFGQITFATGALGHWVNNHAGHGETLRQRKVFGTRGSITSPGDRNGRPVELHVDDVGAITDQRILEYAPGYRLDPVAATLFGGDRIWRYNFDFAMTDRKLVALEYHELARCIRTGQQPEVTGAVGLRDVALVYALFESDRAGRPVTIEEVESGAVDAYQREIDQQLGVLESAERVS